MPGFMDDSDTDSDVSYASESSPIHDYPSQSVGPQKKWDAFQVHPPDVDSGSMAAMVWVRRFEKLMLILAYVLTFAIIFAAAVVGKGVTFFMIAQITPPKKTDDPAVVEQDPLLYCNNDGLIPDNTKTYEVNRQGNQTELEQVAWVWCLIFSFCLPEVLALLRSLRVVLFRHWFLPRFREFIFVFLMEALHTVGVAMLVFLALPQMDTTHALALSNCLAIVPGVLLALSRPKKDKNRWLKTPLDVLAILCQLSGALIWPILQWTNYRDDRPKMDYAWSIPVGLILASCGWWECFVHEDSVVPVIRWMWKVKDTMCNKTRYFTYLWISLLKMAIFFFSAWIIVSLNGILADKQPLNFFKLFQESFFSHPFNVTEIQESVLGDEGSSANANEDRYEAILYTIRDVPLDVLWIQIGCTYGAYIFSKFACKVQIQGFSFALPLCAVVPSCITLLLAACGARANDQCAFYGVIPDYLFYKCPTVGDYFDYLWQEQLWMWGLWLISQMWITLHIWFPKTRRLAATEQIFGSPMYNSIFIDQSIVLNRRRDGENDVDFEELRNDFQNQRMTKFEDMYVNDDIGYENNISNTNNPAKKNIRPSDRITKIYGCATMWHENKEEMLEMLKSIFRIDMDYSARRLAQKYLQVVDPDYYEWETHIFFDDAFELEPNNEDEEQIVNQFVKYLVDSMDDAGSYVHCRNIKVKPPKRYPTPYGGRLIWVLPGKTRIVCHLKDKGKIRHKKRWSQCMYMYYLLGFKLMELPISDERKEVMAENTYLLALDGDIDFQPDAITRLVDLMKKNKNLGAACGRIHPTGSGFMQWYQRFEYALGHWLQKSTEHVMGCVLCSPGCFSLFRAKALMDDNVMKMYTKKSDAPRDYVQFDQGEDRWLCTLLLQRGWRVEYSAASDAFTACPEGFNEFFNQRRRWMPSTIANIFDVLSDYKNVTRVNEDISIFYILYQSMLMLGTVIGPGTIFLMLVGAFTQAFGTSNMTSFILNIVPILMFMLACVFLPSKIQLAFAQILSAIYALVMMAVMVGIMLQIKEDGLLAPTTLSIFLVGGSFCLAAVLHPQEFWCLPYGVIYYVTIPSMYMLLVIYSIFNMNDVSWGTRDVPKKKTKADLEEEKKKEEEALKEAKKKKKEGGLLSFMYQQNGKAEKGGMEFNLANLFKCMCFVREDEGDAKKQLVQIAASMEEVTSRLSKIEGALGGGGGGGRGGGLDFRRRSSYGRRQTRGSVMGLSAPLSEVADDVSLDSEGTGFINMQQPLNESNETDTDTDDEYKVQRDELVNPYWIEDRDLRNGPIDFLPGVEVQFFKDLIEKYLEPIPRDEAKEKRDAAALKDLRNQMCFTFFMLNSIFVTVIFLLQQNKDQLFIRWPFGAEANVTYTEQANQHRVEVEYTYLELEPIGLTFVVMFAVVLIIQIIGMLFHRWGTVSQIISTTKLPFCEKKAQDTTNKGALNKQAIAIVQELQKEAKREDDETRFAPGAAGRRNTVHNLMMAQNMKKKEETADLEKRFRNRLQSIRFEDIEQSDNAALRRLSTRRGTLTELQFRRDTFFEGERRRSTVQFDTMARRMSSMDPGITNDSIGDSDYSGSGYGSYHGSHLDVVSDSDSSGDGVTTL